MAIAIKRQDLELLRRVHEAGQRGLTQMEIAAEVGLTLTVLRYRLGNLGFRFVVTQDLEAMLGGARLSDLLERGELVEAEDPEPAEECAA